MTIHNLKNHLHDLWALDPQNIIQLKANHKKISRFNTKTQDIHENWQLLEQLYKPFSWLQAGFASIPLFRAKSWGQSLHTLLENLDYTVPKSIESKQLTFWLDFNQEGLNAPKLIHWTIVNFLIIFIMLTLLAVLINRNIVNIIYSSNIIAALPIPIAIIYVFFLIAILALIILAFLWYCLWIKIPYNRINNFYAKILAMAWTPLLFLVTVLLLFYQNNYFILCTLLILLNIILKLTTRNETFS